MAIIYKQPTVDIPLPGGGVMPVRGLTFEDISALVTGHLVAITALTERWQATKGDVFANTNVQAFVIQMATSAPEVVAEIIAFGADSPEDIAVAARLPIAVQIAALGEIVRLSVDDLGGLGNLVAVLGPLVKSLVAKGGLGSLIPPQKPLDDSSTDSDPT